MHNLEDQGPGQRLRILTWNINGLRAVLKRKFGTVRHLLDALNADIICFQETKLTKADFDRELALVDGWDSFFSVNRGRSAYSGTATFCRIGKLPVKAAQEGVTGILHTHGETSGCNDLHETGCQYAAATTWGNYSKEELDLIDSEGRCVVTDHGEFVLFNIYGPAITNEESAAQRFAFKLQFYKVRIEALRCQGRRVVVLGDLNISPDPLDNCEPGPDFLEREDRKWLRSLLEVDKGPFVDVFRQYHPTREHAYTCWSQASGARVNNWGARIDLILMADGQLPGSYEPRQVGSSESVKQMLIDSDIWPDLHGSDHCPCWSDLCVPPAPAHADAKDAFCSFSTRNIFTGKQRRLTGWLQQRTSSQASESLLEADGEDTELPAPASTQASINTASKKRSQSQASAPVAKKVKGKFPREAQKQAGPKQSSLANFVKREKPAKPEQQAFLPADASKSSLSPPTQSDVLAKSGDFIDAELARGIAASLQDQGNQSGLLHQRLEDRSSAEEPPDAETLIMYAQNEAEQQEEELEQQIQSMEQSTEPLTSSVQRKSSAKQAWQQIQNRMKPPKCKGHNEDCVIRQVKKRGPNHGRLFYVCRRADGPPPTGRCDFFVWAKS